MEDHLKDDYCNKRLDVDLSIFLSFKWCFDYFLDGKQENYLGHTKIVYGLTYFSDSEEFIEIVIFNTSLKVSSGALLIIIDA